VSNMMDRTRFVNLIVHYDGQFGDESWLNMALNGSTVLDIGKP
jgi:hypothetical protein